MTIVQELHQKYRIRAGFAACAAVLAGLGLAFACASAQAQGREAKGASGDFPFASLFRGPGFTTTTREPVDWVRKTRPSDAELFDRSRRVPAAQPERAPMSREQLLRVESELNAVRARHDRAGRRSIGQPGASAAPEPKTVKKETKPPCVLTCNIGLGTTQRR